MSDTITLTPREEEVARLVAQGRTYGKIADMLGVQPSTVRTHVDHIATKIGPRIIPAKALVRVWAIEHL